MIAFRFLQGFSGGVLIPLCVTIILTNLPRLQQPIGLALFGVAATFAPCIGPTVGGWLTVHFSWPLIFFLNLVPGSLLIFMIGKYMSDGPMQLSLLKKGDYKGIASMSLFLGSFTIVLEEGARKDWFADDTLKYLGILCVISFIFFIFHALRVKNPVINLRLLGRRNFGLSSLATTIFGFGLYGSIYLIPYFLAQIQHLNALEIGKVIMWSGLPQLLILPLIPKLVQKYDNRVLAGIGLFFFGTSALMNSNLTRDWAYDQFFWSQIVRAMGQPFIITPISTLAYVGIESSEIGSASGLYNMLRNLGGSVGIGFLGTLLTNRYRLHFTRISESVSTFSYNVQEQLQYRTHYLQAKSPAGGLKQSIATIYASMNKEALVMSFSDCFLIIGLVFYLGAFLMVFMKKPAAGAAPVVEH